MRLIDLDTLADYMPKDIDSFDDMMYELKDVPVVDAIPRDYHDRCMQIEIERRFQMEEELKELRKIKSGLVDFLSRRSSDGKN